MTHASLFSGIGGPEVAAAMLGWENAFHCEINPFGRAVLEYWFPDSVSYEDITKTDFKPWRGRIDVLTGGFPCQPFSYAGKRGGREDDRYLWPEMLRAIDEIRPAWVCGENVAGITTMVEGGLLADLGGYATLFQEGDELHGYELEQTFTIERICRDLERLGYSVQPVLVPATAVGAPHRRDRIFILAHVADTHGGDDLRGAGQDAAASRSAGIPERDALRLAGEPDQVRFPVCGSAENTQRDGCGIGTDAVEGNQRDIRDTRAGDVERVCGEARADSYDTASRGRGTLPQSVHAGVADGAVPFRDGGKWDAAGMHPEKRWADFPTISPVHRGNDGLPFDVDDLSIPFSKWRTESLKAYGNAIVPQVMYQIFKAIETI